VGITPKVKEVLSEKFLEDGDEKGNVVNDKDSKRLEKREDENDESECTNRIIL
jgi:hypothetical protein